MNQDQVLLWPDGAPGAQGMTDEDKPSVSLYLLKEDRPRPAVVVCPGGGYQRRAPHEGTPIAKWLNSIGFSAVVLGYRVAPYRHPYPLMDLQRALKLVRHNAMKWGIDPTRLGVIGFSAGGHLAALAATQFDAVLWPASDPVDKEGCRPDFAILCYPVITLMEPFTHQGSMKSLVGLQPELRERLSNEQRVSAKTPPTFLWHTADDAVVPVENSLMFAQALRRHKVPFSLHVFPFGRHGLGLAEGSPEVSFWPLLCADWLHTQI